MAITLRICSIKFEILISYGFNIIQKSKFRAADPITPPLILGAREKV
jgi:hypothetical protein